MSESQQEIDEYWINYGRWNYGRRVYDRWVRLGNMDQKQARLEARKLLKKLKQGRPFIYARLIKVSSVVV